MKNLSKILFIPLAYLPAIILLIVSHSLDLQGLWPYYVVATGLVIMIFSESLDGQDLR